MAERDEWMWPAAIAMLDRAERLHRQFFQLASSAAQPAWEPPVDVFETARELIVLTVLPGVAAECVQVELDQGVLTLRGVRSFPNELRRAAIHRLELPQGRFERRVALPAGRYDGAKFSMADGCLVVRLRKTEARP